MRNQRSYDELQVVFCGETRFERFCARFERFVVDVCELVDRIGFPLLSRIVGVEHISESSFPQE